MADVLIVCVREDETQAKALAEMFEGAGFSIGGAPSSDAGLRSSGCGVVVWSQASIRSRPFLDAAQRVINANKAVVASLIEPPPPASIGDSQAFDLSRWEGDPNDPALDPLFFAVDRMVNSARAAVVGTLEPPRADYAPPPRPQPAARRAPPPVAPARHTPAADPLDSEAAQWRAIRNSRDPADFLDYLARFGPDGEFSDVAELRLKELTGKTPEPRAARPIAAPRLDRLESRAAPRPEPPHRAEPPLRRMEAPPPRRPDPPRIEREPARPREERRPYEGRYDRDTRPQRSEGGGGAMRGLLVILLLGGMAAAGAIYFSGQSRNGGAANAPPPSEIAATHDASAPVPLDSETPPEGHPESVALQSITQQAQPARNARAEQQQRRPQQQAREQEPEPPTPAPTMNWTVADNSPRGGPVSLAPRAESETPAPPPAAFTPPAQSVATPVATQTPQRPSRQLQWAQRPGARSIAESYPERALNNGVGGSVVLSCTVAANLSLNCTVASETPAGMGFARAAMSVVRAYRAQPTFADGASVVGAQTRIPIQFRPPR